MFNANCPINPSTPPKAKAAPGAANFEIPDDGINLFTSAVAIMPPPTPSATFCKVLDPVIDFNDVFTLFPLVLALLVFRLGVDDLRLTVRVFVTVLVVLDDDLRFLNPPDFIILANFLLAASCFAEAIRRNYWLKSRPLLNFC